MFPGIVRFSDMMKSFLNSSYIKLFQAYVPWYCTVVLFFSDMMESFLNSSYKANYSRPTCCEGRRSLYLLAKDLEEPPSDFWLLFLILSMCLAKAISDRFWAAAAAEPPPLFPFDF